MTFRTEDHQGEKLPVPPVTLGFKSLANDHQVLKLPVVAGELDAGVLAGWGGGGVLGYVGGSCGNVMVAIVVVDVIKSVLLDVSEPVGSLTIRTAGGTLAV